MLVLRKQYTNGIADSLLAKYAVGEASTEENGMVKKWLDRNETNRHYMDGLLRIVELCHLSDHAGVDEDAAWRNFSQKISHPKNDQGTIHPLYKWIAAAVVVLIFGAAYFILEINKKPLEKPSSVFHKIYGDGFQTDILPDGTWIMLDVNSSLSYTTPFETSERTVKLSGGGFFSVAHDPTRPFVIEVNDLHIRDVGTSFEIRSDSTKTSVAVQSGIIEVSRKKATIRLTRGEKLLVLKSDTVLNKEPAEIPVPIKKNIKQRKIFELSLTEDVGKQKQIVKNILTDIKDRRLVAATGDSVKWFVLTTSDFIINGQKQPANIQKIFSEKFRVKTDQGFFYGPVEMTGKGFFITEKELYREP